MKARLLTHSEKHPITIYNMLYQGYGELVIMDLVNRQNAHQIFDANIYSLGMVFSHVPSIPYKEEVNCYHHFMGLYYLINTDNGNFYCEYKNLEVIEGEIAYSNIPEEAKYAQYCNELILKSDIKKEMSQYDQNLLKKYIISSCRDFLFSLTPMS